MTSSEYEGVLMKSTNIPHLLFRSQVLAEALESRW